MSLDVAGLMKLLLLLAVPQLCVAGPIPAQTADRSTDSQFAVCNIACCTVQPNCSAALHVTCRCDGETQITQPDGHMLDDDRPRPESERAASSSWWKKIIDDISSYWGVINPVCQFFITLCSFIKALCWLFSCIKALWSKLRRNEENGQASLSDVQVE